MKKQLSYKVVKHLFLALQASLVIALSSCSNDFLDAKYPEVISDADTILIINNSPEFTMDLDLQATNGNWKLFQFPYWLDINPKEGTLDNNSSVSFQCKVLDDKINVDLGYYSYPLVFDIEKKGLLEKTVVLANFGNPVINETPSSIDVDYNFKGMYQIKNSGYGILVWHVVNKPSWLKLQTTSGWLNQHDYGIWEFTIDITGLDPGVYTGNVEIESNAQEQNFIIQFHFTIEKTGFYGGFKNGRFIDAKHINSTNQVVVLLKEPNLLLFFNADSPDADTIQLYRDPVCMALSEDEKTIAVGFTNTDITLYSPETLQDLATYPMDIVPVSLGFGTDRWLYFVSTENATGFSYLYSKHLDRGTINKAKKNVNYIVPLVKVPGKDLMLSSRPGASPESLFVFDIAEGNTDSVNEYWLGMNNFWLSESGKRIYTGTKKIYNIPDYIPGKTWTLEEPPVFGTFGLEENRYIHCITDHNSTHKFYVASADGWFGEKAYFTQYDAQTLAKLKTYTLTPSPSPDFPPGNTWWTKNLRIFCTTDGNELWIIQEYPNKNYLLPNVWTVERMSVN